MSELILEINNLRAGYTKDNNILNGLNLQINKGEIVAIVGQNGAGKSTLAKAIMGMTPYRSGVINYCQDINLIHHPTNQLHNLGIVFFMQGGEIFTNLTVEENLLFAGRKLDRKAFKEKYTKVCDYFDLLKNNSRSKMKASFLSGGEQHQLALTMVLMEDPKLLILDEPSAGLSPINRSKMFESIKLINKNMDVNIMLIEQNVNEALKVSDKIGLLKLGSIVKIEKKEKIKKIDQFFWN